MGALWDAREIAGAQAEIFAFSSGMSEIPGDWMKANDMPLRRTVRTSQGK